jgi:hypothetical protein
VFPDLSDRDKYQESIDEKSDEGMNKMKSLMGKLDSFLSK